MCATNPRRRLQQQTKIRVDTIKLANSNAIASGAMVVHRVIFSTYPFNKWIVNCSFLLRTAAHVSIYDWQGMPLDDMQTLTNQQAEFNEYKYKHLEPLVRKYVRNYYARETNKKCWRLCDMWFTAFLVNQEARYLWEYTDGGHENFLFY